MKKSITLLMLLFLLLVVSGCDSGGSSNSQSSITKPMEVKSEEIIDDYIRDQTSAEQKYKDKNVKLTGKVISKGQFNNAADFFIIAGVKNLGEKKYTLVVDYPTDKVDVVNAAKTDDFLVVEGIVVGVVPQKDPTLVSIQIYAGTK